MLPSVKGFKRTRVSMFIWLIILLPVPLLLINLGVVFVVLATLLNLGWIALGLTTFKKNSDRNKMGNTNVYIFTKLFSDLFRVSCDCFITYFDLD